MNSPLKTASPLGVRGPHHDALAEIWGGLFYLKHDDDESDGAALQGPCHVPRANTPVNSSGVDPTIPCLLSSFKPPKRGFCCALACPYRLSLPTPRLTSMSQRRVCLNSAQVRQGAVCLQGDHLGQGEDQTRCAVPSASRGERLSVHASVNKEERISPN